MKKNTLLLLIVPVVVLASLLSGCTGYADGPALSVKRAEVLILRKWKVDEAVQAGSDITAQFAGEFLEFKAEGVFRRQESTFPINIPPFTQNTTLALTGEGEWQFLDDKRVIEVLYTFSYVDPYNSAVLYRKTENEFWEITRLTEEELWLESGDTTLRLLPF
ncbi:MAG: hypothetical protein EAZ89_19105 [Bacteroidetes bacterium]|nr:MAG: hypothetical protein EAZ89_19105 [Bacteroidota bacterium]